MTPHCKGGPHGPGGLPKGTKPMWGRRFRLPRRATLASGFNRAAKTAVLLTLLLLPVALSAAPTESDLRRALAAKTGAVTLPAGEIEIAREIQLPPDAHDLDIRGVGTTIKASAAFRGRALLVLPAGKNIRIRDLSLDGNRDAVARMIGQPPAGTMYSRFFPDNGIVAEGVTGLEIGPLKATRIAGFTVLVNSSHTVRLHDVEMTESGGFNAMRRNNSAGGILIEENTTDFEIRKCLFGKLRGNGITVRSSQRGQILENELAVLAGDGIRLGPAGEITVENNRARQIGYPADEADTFGTSLPAALSATAGVDHSLIHGNEFEEIAGRCFGLENLADSEVSANTCTETPFGAVTLSGARNNVSGNHLRRLNLTHRDDPEILRAGIYLAAGASGNIVGNNEIGGYGMSRHCIGMAPEVPAAANRIAKNECSDEASVARLLPATPH